MFQIVTSGIAKKGGLLFFMSCIVIAFGYGVLAGRYQIFPYSVLKFGQDSLIQVFRERETLIGTRPTQFLFEARYEGSGVTRRSSAATPGLTFTTGFFDDANEMRLLRLDGSVVNRWPVSFYELFPEPVHIRPETLVPRSDWNASIHGSLVLPDGSVVFNFTYLGTVKLDRCGNVQWTLARMNHHSIARAEAGGYWIPSSRYIEGEPQHPRLETPYREDTILRVSEDGHVLSEISVLEILFKNDLEGFMFGRGYRTGDVTHLNDVEELGSDMADAFPQFVAGDLLVSLRMEHLVFVVDPDTLEVKWFRAGPWIGQHDPDFQPNGKITVFSNNDDGTTAGSILGGSTIMEIDPVSDRVVTLFGGRPEQPAFSSERGKHQVIGDAGDHILFTEALSGRVFEVDRAGEVVWEFINRYDEHDVAVVTGATRYPEEYFEVEDWSCE